MKAYIAETYEQEVDNRVKQMKFVVWLENR